MQSIVENLDLILPVLIALAAIITAVARKTANKTDDKVARIFSSLVDALASLSAKKDRPTGHDVKTSNNKDADKKRRRS